MSNNNALTPEQIQQKIKVTNNSNVNSNPQNAINLKQGQKPNEGKPITEPISNNSNNNQSIGQHGTSQDGNTIATKDNKSKQSIQEVQGNIAAEIAAGRGDIVQGQAASASQSPEKPQNSIKLLDIGSVENQENARKLDWYLNLANPVFKVVENEEISRDNDGNEIKKVNKQRVLVGYEYYDVDGVPLKDWIINTFGPEYKLNVQNNTVEKISNE